MAVSGTPLALMHTYGLAALCRDAARSLVPSLCTLKTGTDLIEALTGETNGMCMRRDLYEVAKTYYTHDHLANVEADISRYHSFTIACNRLFGGVAVSQFQRCMF